MNKISICSVAVISNLTVCDGDGVSSTFLAVMQCSLIFFCSVAVFRPPSRMSPSLSPVDRRDLANVVILEAVSIGQVVTI